MFKILFSSYTINVVLSDANLIKTVLELFFEKCIWIYLQIKRIVSQNSFTLFVNKKWLFEQICNYNNNKVQIMI